MQYFYSHVLEKLVFFVLKFIDTIGQRTVTHIVAVMLMCVWTISRLASILCCSSGSYFCWMVYVIMHTVCILGTLLLCFNSFSLHQQSRRYLDFSYLGLPYLTFGVGRLLHLPRAEAVSVRPSAQLRYNQRSQWSAAKLKSALKLKVHQPLSTGDV